MATTPNEDLAGLSPTDAGLSRTELLKASPPMFESALLDRFTRVHPIVPVVLFLPAIVVFFVLGLVNGSGWATAAWVPAGYAFWTLSEYWIHRAVFHWAPEKGIGARLHFLMHGVHHEHPNDPLRLVMPPSVSVPLATLFVLGFYLALGSPAFLPLTAGFLGGYLIYDMTHYHLHHHKANTRLGKALRDSHMRHHFQDDTTFFGISAPYWDHVFGTAPKARKG